MKKTLLHSLTFPPDTISTGMIVSEIADGINNELNFIEVLASYPQYNLKSFDSFNNNKKNIETRTYKNIKVHYLKSKPRHYSNFLRFFQWINFNFRSILFIYKNRKSYDNVMIFSYPPTMNLVCIFTSKILKINTVYSLWELYPEIAEKLNEQPNIILKTIFKFIDNYALESVDKVVVNSDELKDYLLNERKIKSKKIKTINHFSPFPKSFNIPNYDKSSIFYAGNTGKPQNLQVFLKFFDKYFPSDWHIDLYGSGKEFSKLSDFSKGNIKVHNYLERDKLDTAVKDIPFALICLDYEITVEAFPGKTFDYLSMNKILINFSNPDSAVSKLIEKYGLGINIDVNNPKSFLNKLQVLKGPEEIKKILDNISNFQKNISNKKIVCKKYLELISPSS